MRRGGWRSFGLRRRNLVGLGLAFGFGALALFQHQLAAAEAGLLQAAQQQLTEIGGAGIGIEDAQMHTVGAGQAASRQVRRIAQRLD